MRYGFGVDIGGTTVKLAFFEESGKLLDKWEIPTVTADCGKQILPDVASSILAFLQNRGVDRKQVIGIGVGVPGPVDGTGVVNRCINLGWGVFNIAQALSELTGFPVTAGNDANVAALGEYWMGGGAGYRSLVMVTLGTGVGGGIVLDGKLLHGAHGAGGEIGHLVLRKGEQEPCGCGKFGKNSDFNAVCDLPYARIGSPAAWDLPSPRVSASFLPAYPASSSPLPGLIIRPKKGAYAKKSVAHLRYRFFFMQNDPTPA